MRATSSACLRSTATRTVIALVLCLFLPAGGAQGSVAPHEQPAPETSDRADAATRTRVAETYAQLPLTFEANRGQSDESVRFLARGSGYTLFLAPNEAVLALAGPPATPSAVLRLTLLGADPAPRLDGLGELPGKLSYLLGDRPDQWHTAVPTYSQVRYREPYPGIDLIFYGNQRQLEYDFVVAPGVDPAAIDLRIEGSLGLSVDTAGDLVVRTTGGDVRWQKPYLYQDIGGTRQEIAGSYVLRGPREVGFHVGSYDPTVPLVIDPVLVYSTLLGGGDVDQGHDITVDRLGHAYVAGVAASADFPTVNPSLAARATGNDAFVTKLSTDGSGLVFSTFLGGTANDEINGIALDAEGNIYLGGVTASTDFPTLNPVADALRGDTDLFVAKLNASGDELLYSTYFGGSVGFLNGVDSVIDLALDAANAIYVTGITTSEDFLVSAGVAQATYGGSEDAYVAKFDPAAAGAASLVYATYLGGTDLERGVSIAVDSAGNAYVAGRTDSLDFPVTDSAFQTEEQGGPPEVANLDAFVTKVSADGSSLLYSTYLGGTLGDLAYGIAVDDAGIGLAYVTGHTYSSDFPVSAASFDRSLDGPSDVFVAVIHTALAGEASRLAATYLGGTGDDAGFAIAIDPHSNLVLTGVTNSTDFPVTADAVQTANAGGALDALVVRLSSILAEPPSYSTLLGTPGDDRGLDVAVGTEADVFVTGFADGDGFPTTVDAFDKTAGGGHDAFVARFTTAPDAATPAPAG